MSKYFGLRNKKNNIERYSYKPEIKEKIEEYIKNACDAAIDINEERQGGIIYHGKI